jgi:hypothetical protein
MGNLSSRTHASIFTLITVPIAVVGSLILVACDGSTVDPPTDERIEEPSSVELIGASQRTLLSLGQMDAIEGMVNERKVPVTLSVLSENRWNAGRPVLIIEEEYGVVYAHGAGTVVLAVGHKGGHSTPDTLTVHVRPEEPYVLDVEAPIVANETTPAVLRGWKLDSLKPEDVKAGPAARAVEPIDSTRLAVYWAAVETHTCEAIASAEPLVIAGATKLWGQVEISLPKAGALQLEKGMIQRLKQEDLSCLLLPHGEYALAFFDPQFSYPDRFIPPNPNLSFDVKVDPPYRMPAPSSTVLSHEGDIRGPAGVRHHHLTKPLPSLEVMHRAGGSATVSSNDWWSYDPYVVGDTLE